MEFDEERGKIERVLDIYSRLRDGQIVNKLDIADQYGVAPRSVQRDMEDIRNFLDNQKVSKGKQAQLVYDRKRKGFCLEDLGTSGYMFTNDEILAVSKILLASRAFPKKTIDRLLQKLISACVPAINRKLVSNLVSNERYHYIPPKHGKDVIDMMWTLGEAIENHQIVDIRYRRIKGATLTNRSLRPLAIMFSEMYFYLIAFINDPELENRHKDGYFPTIFRIDRIQKLTVTNEHFAVPYRDRFEEGEFRKRIQFMTGGPLKKIRFQYNGASIESVLDKLPTAKILKEKDGVYTIEAEVYGNGIDMWIRSQGDSISLL